MQIECKISLLRKKTLNDQFCLNSQEMTPDRFEEFNFYTDLFERPVEGGLICAR